MPPDFDPLKEVVISPLLDNTQIPEINKDQTASPGEAKIDLRSQIGGGAENLNDIGTEENPVISTDDIISEISPPKVAIEDDDLLGTMMSSTASQKDTGVSGEKDLDLLNSFEDIARLLFSGEYDFLTLSPEEKDILLSLRKEKKEVLSKHISRESYTHILPKFKDIFGFPPEVLSSEVENKVKTTIDTKLCETVGKIVPGIYGEKIFLKLRIIPESETQKIKTKVSTSSIIGFLVATVFVALIMGGAFLTFVVLNAQSIQDVQFFYSLGISLNDINTFISKLVTIIFSVLLFIETSVLAIFLFRFFLTKKIFKRKKVIYGIVSTGVILATFLTGSTWMIIDRKIKSLPNWQELAYGDIQIYDNDRLSSDEFEKSDALLTTTNELIGPVTLKYDLSLFAKNEEKSGFTIRKYIWNFGEEVIEEFNPVIIKTFQEKGNYEVSLTVEGTDTTGKTLEKIVDDLPVVIVGYTVKVTENTTNNGGKTFSFDASDLKDLGKVEWYMKGVSGELEKVWDGLTFKPSKIFFEQTLVGISINNPNKKTNTIDKLFVLGVDSTGELAGKIEAVQSTKNELEYELSVQNPENSFGDGFVEGFEWIIGDRKITKKSDPSDLQGSSKILFSFQNYGENKVSVLLRDASGKVKEITKSINIVKNTLLKSTLRIFNNEEEIQNVRYDEKNHEYFIDELGIPAKLKLDARLVKSDNLTYSLQEVSWNFGKDDSIDGTGKTIDYEISTEGNHSVAVTYTFVHRKISTDIVKLTEYIYIEGIKKEALLDLKIEKDTDYVPVTVRFDASKSFIKNDDIVKFIYDYGDGVSEERDAINPGHRYTNPGDYTVKLIAVGKTGKSYNIEKKLILKPAAQETKIGVSLRKAPTGQGIDFSSEESEGRIIAYLWNFGDGESSVDANPTHAYKKEGNYTVVLRVDYENNNSLTDEMEIEIYKE